MTSQERLNNRVEKARHVVKAGFVHPRDGDILAFRMPSRSQPGSWHDVWLRWSENSEGQKVGLYGACAWVEPVTGSQTHCLGNQRTVCWHVLSSIIEALENANGSKKVAFFVDRESAEHYSHLGGTPIPILGKDIWFVVTDNKPRRSVAQDMEDLFGKDS